MVGGVFHADSQGEELEHDIECELGIAASDAQHGKWRNCREMDQRVRHRTQVMGTWRYSVAGRGARDQDNKN